MQKFASFCAAFVVLSFLAAPALAASNGSTAQPVMLQAGPGTEFPEVMRLAPNLKITIHGCARAWDWCDVEWRGNRGWVPALALHYRLDRSLLPVSSYGPRIGLPEVEFDLTKYWEAHYQQRPWYPQRHEWSARLTSTNLAAVN
ncbi:MAG: SH3 domain-containing protein [Rhodospirillaceae bacterium]